MIVTVRLFLSGLSIHLDYLMTWPMKYTCLLKETVYITLNSICPLKFKKSLTILFELICSEWSLSYHVLSFENFAVKPSITISGFKCLVHGTRLCQDPLFVGGGTSC